jgi:anti-anti-sigma factor
VTVKDLVSDLIERDRHRRLVLNLRDQRHIEATGFGVLVASLKRAQKLEAAVVIAFAPTQFTHLLDLTGVSTMFVAFENVHSALAGISARKPRYSRPGR